MHLSSSIGIKETEMTYLTYLQAYQGTPSLTELNEAHNWLTNKIEDAKLEVKTSAFHPLFMKFLVSGDITELAPTGTMDKATYEATKSHVFADIEHVSGRTIMGRYLSGKSFTGVMPTDSSLIGELTRGPCVVIHENNQIAGWLQLDRDQLKLYGGLFNSVASKSKGAK